MYAKVISVKRKQQKNTKHVMGKRPIAAGTSF